MILSQAPGTARARARQRGERLAFFGSILSAPFWVGACSGDDISTLPGSSQPSPPAHEEPDSTGEPESDSTSDGFVNSAFHIEVRGGVRIAVDLWLPRGADESHPLATVVRATRYWRDQQVVDRESTPETENEAMAKSFVRGGYAYMAIDARGTGASFGVGTQPWSPAEVADYAEIVDWIGQQPWSNGRIGAFGISYDSNTAEMIATLGKEEVVAVIPRFGYPDVYADVMFPGGIFNEAFMSAWLERAKLMDANDICALALLSGPDCDAAVASGAGLKGVDGDLDLSQRAAALAEHGTGPDQFAAVSALDYVDDVWAGANFAALSPGSFGQRAEANQTPFMAWASWMDLGTAQGALNRWATTDVPMVVYIGPWNHDASEDANPFRPKDAPLELAGAEQRRMELAFFDRHLKVSSEPAAARQIHYYTLGENVWKETSVWPPANSEMTPIYLRAEHALSRSQASVAEPADSYVVDFTASTGAENGWWTKLTAGDVHQPDRRTEDDKLLVYTSAPLEVDTEISGHPQVTLYLASSETDGAVFVYLEDVAPDGAVTYITEGELRLIHRKLCSEPASFNVYGPCHTYASSDAEPLPKNTIEEVSVGLHPTSVLLRAGHSIRVALAGHDASSFARIPAEAVPVLSVAHGLEYPSRIELPIVRR